MQLYCEQSGHGRPVTLLHGWGIHGGIWDGLRPYLDGLHVSVFDLPGHGHSPLLDDMSLDGIATAITRQLPANSLLVGWSLGGLIAQRIAAQTTAGQLRGVLCIASTPSFVRRSDWPAAMETATLDQFAGQLSQDPATTVQRFLALQVRGCADERALLRTLRQTLQARPLPQTTALQAGLAMLKHSDLRSDITRLNCPAHWLFGRRDTLVPAAVIDALTACHPDLQHTLLDAAGHAPLLSHPRQVAEVIRRLDAE
ncbi:MAG: pimeloyl-ACP methyl ester esterase BioH [Gammaproteobacteria bacterium]|nr:pimeloyl-ACP methyl ester esterase BioH [Gammaproteobacteria bacterium]